ncbi:NAD-glutamate dehydrogenase [Terricaulis silvestris]|uniref:NAD-specific glutamate dehydrogenase n=1 Tax=Terricaulis silvestris TaxID=2686094 RepID=A0A6I6MTF9_9CAUL|nr:NAD-glutamate dehydrogenase [Terricaulis silvestris]QGZ96736.1 NAD-specific glutamate dehydrogenase [Terricaulis silvestris]
MDAAARQELPKTADQFVATVVKGPWPAFKANGAMDAAAEAFLRGLYEDASDDELGDLSVADFAAIAHDFWIWRTERQCDEQCVRVRRAVGVNGVQLDRDILEIAGPDMPFLVDSVMGEISDQGITTLAMFHPLAPATNGRDRDSLIQIHLPRLSAQRAKALHDGVRGSLADVRASVADFKAMRQRMLHAAEELETATTNAPPEEVAEAVALLRWLAADKFTFLGSRDYKYTRLADGSYKPDEPEILSASCLGVLRDLDLYVLRTSAEPMVLTPELKRLVAEPAPLVVAKSTIRARVHRRATADYISVKRYNDKGEATGEVRFVGLFTSESFTESTRNIPMLRRKAEWVMDQAAFAPGGHNAKTLRKIIEYYPREELWQMSREELLRISRGILHLLDRPRARLFTRRDRFNRFVTALVYIPKDRYDSDIREKVGSLIARAYGGIVESFQPQLGEGQLARVLFVIGEIDKTRPEPNAQQLDAEVATLTHTWEDTFRAELMRSPLFDAAAREEASNRFDDAFTASYRERYGVDEGITDTIEILGASDGEVIRARAYRMESDALNTVRCKFYTRGDVLALSAVVPILENLGLFVDSEINFELNLKASALHPAQRIYVHDIETRSADGAPIDLVRAGYKFEEAFTAVWTGKAESDGFNRLILALSCSWREAALVRALARYRQQSGLDPTQSVQEQALANNPKIASLILAFFKARFDPNLPETMETRQIRSSKLEFMVEAALTEVVSLDEDRALRRIAHLVKAIRRTNYYQPGADGQPKPYMSFKIDSNAVAELPAPKPYREIWVASPQVEGVHLRFGPVARGGLRWSDRRDDFRTEVLDLVKAQQVKNAIIVPVGAKGGFYPKRLPARGAANYQEAGIEAYKTFLRGLLDITDNIVGDSIKAPNNVVRWDDDDAYLVVAADKGTATFSDIANGISAEYGHWLGDAFASGGSVGYDHKAMGITAKGAWVAVQRHFREIGKDIQEKEFTVIGVGDMSGDVFGNGMLLSRKIRLLAAFDHRDIFIDPNPKDCEASWIERKRLFDTPRTSWADYDKKLISKGGGVFSRSLKSIEISTEIAALTGIDKASVTPTELMSALLKAQCELMWFGGIGNYIKARAESHGDVGDKANDGVRVDAEDVRAQVVGEGANLGVTHKGRIAFARAGGRINTDAIDNSAGVDTSDHEVNIKILLSEVIRSGALKADKRDKLLESMTDEVGALVLEDNYDQTGAISIAQASAVNDLDSHERFIQRLESEGKLNRRVEGLPLTGEFASLRAAKLGLTRPELAKLVAYSKINLFDALVASATPDDPAFEEPLKRYFPKELWKFEAQMKTHRLRREIVATQLADDLVNRCGPSFVDRIKDISRAKTVTVACAFEASRRIFELEDLVDRINALDNKVPAVAQIALHQRVGGALRRATTYLSRTAGFELDTPPSILDVVKLYREPVAAQRKHLWEEMSAVECARAEARQAALMELGAPEDLALEAGLLLPLTSALDVSDLARRSGWPVHEAALLHCVVGAEFGIDALRDAASNLKLEQHWDRLVVRRVGEDFGETQLKLAEAAAKAIGAPPNNADAHGIGEAAKGWITSLGQPALRVRSAYAELNAQPPWTFAKLMLISAELNAFAAAVR